MLAIDETRKKKIVWLWILGDWGGHIYFKVWFRWGEVIGYRRWVLWLTLVINIVHGVALVYAYSWLLQQIGDLSTPLMSNVERLLLPLLFYVAFPLIAILTFGIDLVRLLLLLLLLRRR